jgi:ABC-2 type transport system ATP-binding protein
MKRRLNMAAGMIHRPRMVLMDEPTVGVDPQSRNRIFEMIEALRAQGTSILYTTHYMKEAERLCNDHGSIIAEGRHEELVRNAFGSSSQVAARFAGCGKRDRRVGREARRTYCRRGSAIHGSASQRDCRAAGRCERARV